MATRNVVLATQRCNLRLFENTDVENLYSLYSDSDVTQFLPGKRTRDVAEDHVNSFARQYENSWFTLWAVECNTSGEFVGRVGLWPLDQTDEIELGYIIARRFWGKGIATETSAACLDYAFSKLKLPSIAAITVAENYASLRVMQKLGFRLVRPDRYYDTDVLYHRLEGKPSASGS